MPNVKSITYCEECGRRIEEPAFSDRFAAWLTAAAGEYRCEDCERERERLTVAPYELAGRVIA